MARGWVQLGGIGGVLSLPLIVLAAISNEVGSGDFREGPFAWLVAATGAAVALFASGLWHFVEPSRSGVLRLSAALLLVGSLGLLALFGGIAVGAALRIDEPRLIGMGPIAAGIAALRGPRLVCTALRETALPQNPCRPLEGDCREPALRLSKHVLSTVEGGAKPRRLS